MPSALLTIGELSVRSGVAASALRYYEARGLISAHRTGGRQRRFERSQLRRVAVIRAAQALGLSLDEIAEALATLPGERTPTARDWGRLSRSWRRRIDRQIEDLERLRDELTSCIGCGCLTLSRCALLNPGDEAGSLGSGPRYLLDHDAVDPLLDASPGPMPRTGQRRV